MYFLPAGSRAGLAHTAVGARAAPRARPAAGSGSSPSLQSAALNTISAASSAPEPRTLRDSCLSPPVCSPQVSRSHTSVSPRRVFPFPPSVSVP